jgi:hypothetical protein
VVLGVLRLQPPHKSDLVSVSMGLALAERNARDQRGMRQEYREAAKEVAEKAAALLRTLVKQDRSVLTPVGEPEGKKEMGWRAQLAEEQLAKKVEEGRAKMGWGEKESEGKEEEKEEEEEVEDKESKESKREPAKEKREKKRAWARRCEKPASEKQEEKEGARRRNPKRKTRATSATVSEAAPLVSEAAPLASEAAPLASEAAPLVSEAAPLISEAKPSIRARAAEAVARARVRAAEELMLRRSARRVLRSAKCSEEHSESDDEKKRSVRAKRSMLWGPGVRPDLPVSDDEAV